MPDRSITVSPAATYDPTDSASLVASKPNDRKSASHSPGDANPIPASVRYRDAIYKAATAHGVDPLLMAAQAAQESGGPTSNSGSNIVQRGGGGHGLYQIDSGTYGEWLKTHHNGLNVQENANKAAEIDAQNLKVTGGNVGDAMHLYNAGHLGGATTQTTFPDGQTLSYPAAVQHHLKMLEELKASQQR